MKRLMKRAIVIIIVLLTAIGGSGCMFDTVTKIQKDMLAYMKEKYDEDFEFVSSGTELFGATYKEMWVRSENLPDVDICVHMDLKTKIFSDNYICYLMQRELDDYVSKVFEEVYGKNQVFGLIPSNSIELLPIDITKGISLMEYAEAINPKMYYQIYIYSDVLEKNENAKRLEETLNTYKLQIDFVLYYVKDKSLIGIINKRNTQNSNWMRENVITFASFYMDADFKFDGFNESTDWR